MKICKKYMKMTFNEMMYDPDGIVMLLCLITGCIQSDAKVMHKNNILTKNMQKINEDVKRLYENNI